MRIAIVLFTLVCACGKGKKAEDWSKTPLKLTDASAGGVQYQIALPDTWQPRSPDEGWGPTTGDKFQRPYATVSNVSLELASSLESAISAANANPEQLVRKETKPDGYALTEVHGTTMIRATVFKKVGGSFLWCTAAQANDDGIPKFDETKKALVKICDSIVAR